MANTFELIFSGTVGSGGASSIDFTSIPSTFTDICVVLSTRSSRSGFNDGLKCAFNGSATSFTAKILEGSGSAASSSSASIADMGSFNAATSTASTFTTTQLYIPNYAGSTYKSWSVDNAMEANQTTAYMQLIAGLWSNTAAITSLSFASQLGATFVQYSTAYLYGVKNA